VSVLDGSVADLVPFVFPGVYLIALAVLHVFANVRPTHALLKNRHTQFSGSGIAPIDTVDRPAWRSSQSAVLAGWRTLHHHEVQQVNELAAAELSVELRAGAQELTTDESTAWIRERAGELADQLAGGNPPAAVLEEAKALGRRIRELTFDARDTSFEEAALLYRKAVWLTVVGAAAVAALGATVDSGEAFFLLGAVGGLMSRLNRVLNRRPRANDYGASWCTLILAPMTGALAGWLGVLITETLAVELGVLDKESFKDLFSGAEALSGSREALALSVAFVFGFSERLISRAVSTAEDRIVPRLPDPAASPAPRSTPGVSA
jgi:hypothetical protein